MTKVAYRPTKEVLPDGRELGEVIGAGFTIYNPDTEEKVSIIVARAIQGRWVYDPSFLILRGSPSGLRSSVCELLNKTARPITENVWYIRPEFWKRRVKDLGTQIVRRLEGVEILWGPVFYYDF